MKQGTALADGVVEVKFKPLTGREDQAGGVVWRWKDGDNYYVARANALENNVSLYYTERGSRRTIKYVDAPVPGNAWHTLRVEFKGTRIRVLAGRQGLHRTGRQPHRRAGRGRRVDQGRQRHGVRRLHLPVRTLARMHRGTVRFAAPDRST